MGGDFIFYRFRKGVTPRFFSRQFVDNKDVEEVKTVSYQHNVFVMFLNSIHSVHGVAVRQNTRWPRLYVNVIGEVKPKLFNLGEYAEGRIRSIFRKYIWGLPSYK